MQLHTGESSHIKNRCAAYFGTAVFVFPVRPGVGVSWKRKKPNHDVKVVFVVLFAVIRRFGAGGTAKAPAQFDLHLKKMQAQ